MCLINMLIYRLYTDCNRARGHNVVMKFVPNTARNSMCCKIKKVCDLECSVCHMSEYFKLILMGIKLLEPTTSNLWAFWLLFFLQKYKIFLPSGFNTTEFCRSWTGSARLCLIGSEWFNHRLQECLTGASKLACFYHEVKGHSCFSFVLLCLHFKSKSGVVLF